MPESGSAYEIRTRVPALRGLCPGPLDECAIASPTDENPGSSPNGSNSLEENPAANRAQGIETRVSRPNVSSPSTKHNAQERLDEIARHREHLIAQEKKRLGATRLLDSDYDRIASWMQAWKQRRYGVQA